MTEMNSEQWDLEKIKSYDDSWWLEYLRANTVFDSKQIKDQKDWLIEQAERVQELEGENSHLIKIGNLKINRLQEENKLLQDKLNYVKSLVESKRAGHAIKFDLQMMFREGDE